MVNTRRPMPRPKTFSKRRATALSLTALLALSMAQPTQPKLRP